MADSLDLSGEELDEIEGLADSAESVARRKRVSSSKKIRKEREDTAYGAALKHIRNKGFQGKEAGKLARTVGDALADGRQKSSLHDHPRSPKSKEKDD